MIYIGDEAIINPNATCKVCGGREVLIKTPEGYMETNLTGELVCKNKADCKRYQVSKGVRIVPIFNEKDEHKGFQVTNNGKNVLEVIEE